MRIFADEEGAWQSKVNFVDEHNVVVWYDTSQKCCEAAGWFISPREVVGVISGRDVSERTLIDYRFDPTYFEETGKDKGGCLSLSIARFRLVPLGGRPDLYLHLHNTHNGYYTHGFAATIVDQPWQSGGL